MFLINENVFCKRLHSIGFFVLFVNHFNLNIPCLPCQFLFQFLDVALPRWYATAHYDNSFRQYLFQR